MSTSPSVFTILELLEKILSELPPLEIVQRQRVNSTWRDLIASSPLLQYHTWQRNDILDPVYRILSEDFMPNEELSYSKIIARDYDPYKWYIDNLSRHVHPIVVARDMQSCPQGPSDSFDPLRNMAEDGFGGYFEFRPILIRELMAWYKRNKATEHIWGRMSLCRPGARVVHWEASDSTGNTVPRMKLQAVRIECPDNELCPAKQGSNETLVYKHPGQPLILTLSDLMGWLDHAWHLWLEAEHQEHDFWYSNDSGCMGDKGIPREECLRSDNGEEEIDDEDYVPCEKHGPRRTMNEHIDMRVDACSV